MVSNIPDLGPSSENQGFLCDPVHSIRSHVRWPLNHDHHHVYAPAELGHQLSVPYTERDRPH